jgi:5'-3' exonuclease
MQYDKLIIDGNNFLFRAFFTKRPEKIIEGVNATAIHQFLHMFRTMVSRFEPKEVYLTWDKKLNPTKSNFRKELVPYKEHRIENEHAERMFATIPIIQEFMDNLGVITVYPVNMEADDVIRFCAINDTKSTIIVSSDNDLFQLVTEEVHQYIPTKNIILTLENFEEVVSVKPEQYLGYKAILGDKSDNISGLSGHGPVKSKALAEKISQIIECNNCTIQEAIVSDLNLEDATVVCRNLRVMDLGYTEFEQPEEYEFYKEQVKCSDNSFNSDKVKELFSRFGMHQFLREFGNWNKLFNPDYDNSDLLSMIVM